MSLFLSSLSFFASSTATRTLFVCISPLHRLAIGRAPVAQPRRHFANKPAQTDHVPMITDTDSNSTIQQTSTQDPAAAAQARSNRLAPGRPRRRGFLQNPVAGSVHLLADVVDVGRSAIVGSVKGSTHIAVSTLDSVSDTVVPRLPKVYDVPVPKFVKSTVDGIAGTSRVANSTVGFGVKVVENVGAHVGSAVGNLVLPKATATTPTTLEDDAIDDEEEEDDENDNKKGAGFFADTAFAVKRLFGSTTSTISDSIHAVDEATDTLMASTKRNSEAVVRQTFGDESAKLVSSAVDIAATNVKSFKTIKTLTATVTTPHSAIGIAQKSAVKAALNSRHEQARTKQAKASSGDDRQPWQPEPQPDDAIGLTSTPSRKNTRDEQ
jgi:hypothetical protein